MNVRRIATGHDRDGKAIIASDEILSGDPIGDSGNTMYRLWGRMDTASFPDDGSRPDFDGALPPVGGCMFQMMRYAPGGSGDLDDLVSDVLGDSERPGMHRTATIDMAMVIVGSLELELDDGVVVTLNAGDVFVQNGTTHRWSNPSGNEAVVVGVAVGAHHALPHFGH